MVIFHPQQTSRRGMFCMDCHQQEVLCPGCVLSLSIHPSTAEQRAICDGSDMKEIRGHIFPGRRTELLLLLLRMMMMLNILPSSSSLTCLPVRPQSCLCDDNKTNSPDICEHYSILIRCWQKEEGPEEMSSPPPLRTLLGLFLKHDCD